MHLEIIKITYNRTATHFMDDSFVNLGVEVTLTLLSGASESATVCLVISLSICYWLFKCRVLHIVCVCEWETEREGHIILIVACMWERGEQGHITPDCTAYQKCFNRGLCANTYEFHHWVCHATLFLSRAWTDAKTKHIIYCLYFQIES